MKETKPQTKLPINKEAFRMLSHEIGLNAACRKLGVPINTGKSWSHRGGWDLPKRHSGRPQRSLDATNATSSHTIADVLVATHQELGERSRTAILQAGTKAAEAARDRAALDVKDVAQLQQLTGALARVLGWGNDSRPSVNYYGDVNTVVVCDEKRRQELIEQRQRLLEQEATQDSGREVKAAAPVALPAPETLSNGTTDTRKAIVSPASAPTAKQDPLSQWRESIRTAATWGVAQGSDQQENHAGSFGPYPEELEKW